MSETKPIYLDHSSSFNYNANIYEPSSCNVSNIILMPIPFTLISNFIYLAFLWKLIKKGSYIYACNIFKTAVFVLRFFFLPDIYFESNEEHLFSGCINIGIIFKYSGFCSILISAICGKLFAEARRSKKEVVGVFKLFIIYLHVKWKLFLIYFEKFLFIH